MKLIKEKYKTREGASKRMAFERSINPGEFKRGDVASLYSFTVVEHEGFYRVAKERKGS